MYIRCKPPARKAVHFPAQGFSIHYLTFFDRLFFHLPRIVMPSSISFSPTLIGEEPKKQIALKKTCEDRMVVQCNLIQVKELSLLL